MRKPDESTNAHEAIQRVSRRLLEAVNRGDVAGVMTVWASDGVMMPPHHAPVRGHAAIEAYFRDVFARVQLTFAFTESVVEVFERGAVERLTYTALATPADGGPVASDAGSGLHVFRREADGTWRISQDIWHSDR